MIQKAVQINLNGYSWQLREPRKTGDWHVPRMYCVTHGRLWYMSTIIVIWLSNRHLSLLQRFLQWYHICPNELTSYVVTHCLLFHNFHLVIIYVYKTLWTKLKLLKIMIRFKCHGIYSLPLCDWTSLNDGYLVSCKVSDRLQISSSPPYSIIVYYRANKNLSPVSWQVQDITLAQPRF